MLLINEQLMIGFWLFAFLFSECMNIFFFYAGWIKDINKPAFLYVFFCGWKAFSKLKLFLLWILTIDVKKSAFRIRISFCCFGMYGINVLLKNKIKWK